MEGYRFIFSILLQFLQYNRTQCILSEQWILSSCHNNDSGVLWTISFSSSLCWSECMCSVGVCCWYACVFSPPVVLWEYTVRVITAIRAGATVLTARTLGDWLWPRSELHYRCLNDPLLSFNKRFIKERQAHTERQTCDLLEIRGEWRVWNGLKYTHLRLAL